MSGLVRVAAARLFEAAGPLSAAWSSGAASWGARHGILLQLRDEEGGLGQGEASPLPGFSTDSLDEARAALLATPWENLPALRPGEDLPGQVEGFLDRAGLIAPSARFAAETALLDLAGQRLGLPIHVLLAKSGEAHPSSGSSREAPGSPKDRACQSALPLAAALMVNRLDEARRRLAEGYRVLKLKVGRSPAEELALLAALRSEAGADVVLRADANGTLDPDGAAAWLRTAADLGVEFVEEPLPLHDVPRLLPSPVPLALDESLPPGESSTLEAALDRGAYRYVVLKPAYHGGALRCRRLAACARGRGAEPVISHLLGGPVGLAAAAELALALRPCPAAGLAPHPGLAIWPPVALPAFGGGELVPHDRPGLGLPTLSGESGGGAWREIGP
ncbi:MAG: mandelate racemase/muconate lactonizing enzyme family protein [Gemmatimonadota bacterium]|nr:MAG: mandelate racemase/muconate lactonizing enzyme family protein [Gemmatimonadota bacterium]